MPTKVTYIHVKLLITDFIKNIPKTYLQQRRIFIMEQKMFCYQCEQTAETTRKQKIPTASSLKDYLQPSRM